MDDNGWPEAPGAPIAAGRADTEPGDGVALYGARRAAEARGEGHAAYVAGRRRNVRTTYKDGDQPAETGQTQRLPGRRQGKDSAETGQR